MRPWQTAPLFIGPAGWQRPDTANLLAIPESRRPAHPLARVANFTNLAELEQCADGPLKPEVASLWVKKVAHRKDFLFVAPLWRRFTRDRDLAPAAVQEFREGLQPILHARRMGALILEFPWAFRFTRENREFLLHVRRAFHEFPMAAEFRHESWLRDEAFTTLVQCRLAFANLDQPPYFGAMPPAAQLTAGVAVVRFHGRSCPAAHQDFQTDVPPYLYNSDELAEWLPRVRQLARTATRVLVSFTSGAAGRGITNSLQLREMLGEKELRAPAVLIERYPGALAGFRPERPFQPSLLEANPWRSAA